MPRSSNVSLVEDKLVLVPDRHLPLFVTANFVSSFFAGENTQLCACYAYGWRSKEQVTERGHRVLEVAKRQGMADKSLHLCMLSELPRV